MLDKLFRNLYKFRETPAKTEKEVKRVFHGDSKDVDGLLFRKVVRRVVYYIIGSIVLVFIFSLFFSGKYRYKKESKVMIDSEIEDYVDKVTKDCLKHKKASKRNALFDKQKNRFGLKPLKINNMSTVFLNTRIQPNKVIKRALIKSSTQEDTISVDSKHKNLLCTYEYYYTESEDGLEYLWLISEYMDLVIKSNVVNRSEQKLRAIMRDILKGLEYLHDRNIAHLDLKIANIMGKTDPRTGKVTYKIIDFGFARNLNLLKGKPDFVTIPGKSYGTYPYKPPEVVFHNEHGLKSDIWCIGAICWFLIEGRTPFYTDSGNKDRRKWNKFLRNAAVILPDYVSDELYHFIDICMRTDPKERATVEELLKSPFITGRKLDPEYTRRTHPGHFSSTATSSSSTEVSGSL